MSRNSFYGTDGSLPCSQEPAAGPYPHMHLVHTFPPCFPKIHSNIVLPSTPVSSKLSISFRFSDPNYASISQIYHACYTPRQYHPPWLDDPKNS